MAMPRRLPPIIAVSNRGGLAETYKDVSHEDALRVGGDTKAPDYCFRVGGIFLRICEDRGVETYGELRTLLNGENIYGRLRHLYGIADERYNSGLFHFHAEKGRAEAPDELTPTLVLRGPRRNAVVLR